MRGRGSNPKSKENLRKPEYIYCVFDAADNSIVSGPHAFGVAYKKAEKLNKVHPNRYFLDAKRKEN